jgi:asparagine synthase (glutamine-hydrolysing)
MCGIAGLIHFDGRPAGSGLLYDMIHTLEHRGPDDLGVHVEENVGLAHARLSIIDLAGGAQPMCNEDASLWITFNGEIFNYLELREDLLARGHRFVTRSDTEVILHLYEERGADCVHELNGQWAFAIWDRKQRLLFLSRDRLGVRPLFYTTTDHTFLFGSEIKALFAYPEVHRELDCAGLDEVFTYWYTIPPRTVFRNVLELPPGHSMMVRGHSLETHCYWQPEYEPAPNCTDPRRDREYAAQLLDLLIDATRIRLRSDVPVGAYLSGGLDSTLTTALIRKFTQTKLTTFSLSFTDPEFDESPYQREAVRFFDTEHHELRCSAEQIAEVFPDVVWHTEKPLLRTAPAPLYLLSRLVHDQGYKVVVTGEGSDEILGGYDIFKEDKIRRFWAAHPDSKLRPLLLRRLYPYLENLQHQPDSYRKAFFHIQNLESTEAFFSHLPRWELTSKLKIFFSADFLGQVPQRNGYIALQNALPARYFSWPPFCRAQYLETKYLLPGYILSSQGDRVAMAHAVEGRFPFLDYRVVRFASQLPVNLKMKVLEEKYLLKQCARDLIPPSVLTRTKQPYRAPDGDSFLSPAARDYVEELLSPSAIGRYGIFNPASVSKLFDKFHSGRAIGIKDNMALVAIVSTQLLAHQFLHNSIRKDSYHEARVTSIYHR